MQQPDLTIGISGRSHVLNVRLYHDAASWIRQYPGSLSPRNAAPLELALPELFPSRNDGSKFYLAQACLCGRADGVLAYALPRPARARQAVQSVPTSLVRELDGNDSMRVRFEALCRKAQNDICKRIEELDGAGKVRTTPTRRQPVESPSDGQGRSYRAWTSRCRVLLSARRTTVSRSRRRARSGGAPSRPCPRSTQGSEPWARYHQDCAFRWQTVVPAPLAQHFVARIPCQSRCG